MKYSIIFFLAIISLTSKAQGILDTISNSYLTQTNKITTFQEFVDYAGLINFPSEMIEGDSLETVVNYFKIVDSAASNELGLLLVTYHENVNAHTSTVEELKNFFFPILQQGSDPADLVNGIVKHAGVHGFFMFDKYTPGIFIYMLRQPNMDFVRIFVYIENLTSSQQEALARDIIQKTTFINWRFKQLNFHFTPHGLSLEQFRFYVGPVVCRVFRKLSV